MKKLLAATAALSLSACSSIDSAVVAGNEVAANGEAIAVVQATSVGFTVFFHQINIVDSDLDGVINKLLVTEAKAMGATKIDLKSAETTPRHGIFTLPAFLIWFPVSQAVGVAVK